VLALVLVASTAAAQPAPEAPSPVVARLQAALATGSPDALEPLLSPNIDRGELDEFKARWITRGLTRVALKERERITVPSGGQQLVVEALLESGTSGRIATWRVDLDPAQGDEPRIGALKTLSSLDGLFRLALDDTRQFQANNLHIVAEDFELVIPKGSVFLVEVPSGVTGIVILGRGEMTFHPTPATERGQVRLFAGDETLRTAFDGAFIRMHPAEYLSIVNQEALSTVPVDPRTARDAVNLFREEAAKSYSVDLAELSNETWWLVPTQTDLLAEVRTRRFGTLTYARANNEAEDITVFDREKRRNISVYASQGRIASRGRFYAEDDLADYDVIDYGIDLSYAPERSWFEGRVRLKVRIRANALSTMNLKLASSLVVRYVTTDTMGRVLFLRVRNQDSLVVNLPSTLTRDAEFTMTIAYAGPLDPQTLDSEAVGVQQEPVRRVEQDGPVIEAEKSYLYSNRSYWYPQPAMSDYSTASIRLTLPPGLSAACTGAVAAGSPVSLRARGDDRFVHVFTTTQPVRYLGCVMSRFVAGDTRVIPVPRPKAETDGSPAQTRFAAYDALTLRMLVNPRQRMRTAALLDRTADVAAFYASLMHDVPYPSFTLAVLESRVPGGHSPAYFAALNQPLPASPFTWRDDPANFDNFPEFFLAHEVAHQWWGQGVGWQNYHEQWLSEGFAQYFAALYAERRRGPEVFAGVIRSMNRWALTMSDQGPVYLGYRLGHLKGDSRVMRALVYNKGAMVLHMLRRLVGDEVFFRALRRFYTEHRFHKAGTDALRQAFTAESGRDLTRFFDEWIYGSDLPILRWTTKTDGDGAGKALVVRFAQGERVFDFPITVTLQMADGSVKDVIVPVTDRVVEQRIPYTGTLRSVQVNRDRGALVRDES